MTEGGRNSTGGGKISTSQFQMEVENELQWRQVLRREGLIVIDVYASWAGPCTSMLNTLKRVKVEVNDDRLWLAMACSDNIDDLMRFRDQSEPCWLFFAGGKPIRVFRGCNVPEFVNIIKQEFAHELECIKGNARRNIISIDDEASRKKKLEAEATKIANMVLDPAGVEEENLAEELNIIRRESSVSLMKNLEPFTVALIQPFLVRANKTKEIRDYLAGEFKIVMEGTVEIKEEVARKLYQIPYEVLDSGSFYETDEEDNAPSTTADDDDDDSKPKAKEPAKPKPKRRKTLEVPLPEGVVGDSYVMLLEQEDIKQLASKGQTPMDTLLKTADDYLRLRVGPLKYQDAKQHLPYSLHATYGNENIPGIWCPRKYDDKRFAILTFFPNFMEDLLDFKPILFREYMLAILAINVMEHYDENKTIQNLKSGHVWGEKRMKFAPDVAEELLKPYGLKGPEYQMKHGGLVANETFVVSFNPRNEELLEAITALKPAHMSKDNELGRRECALVFPELKVPAEQVSTPEQVVQLFMARAKPRIVSITSLIKAEAEAMGLPMPGEEPEGPTGTDVNPDDGEEEGEGEPAEETLLEDQEDGPAEDDDDEDEQGGKSDSENDE